MARDVILSTISSATTEALIYSTLKAYGGARGHELPGAWFVEALSGLGRTAAAIRQTLFRMVNDMALQARAVDRRKLYRLSAFGSAAVQAGTRKLLEPPERDWDGRWTLVHYQFTSAQRLLRERVRDVLESEGFAAFGPGLYLHPRDHTEQVSKALVEASAESAVTVFRGARVSGGSDQELVDQLWDLARLRRRYAEFLRHFEPLARTAARAWSAEQAFRGRLAVALAYLEIAWDDPQLPDSLLPRDWNGHAARALAADLYQRLLPGTLEHGDRFFNLKSKGNHS